MLLPAGGSLEWKDVMRKFWVPFESAVKSTGEVSVRQVSLLRHLERSFCMISEFLKSF